MLSDTENESPKATPQKADTVGRSSMNGNGAVKQPGTDGQEAEENIFLFWPNIIGMRQPFQFRCCYYVHG